MSVFGTLLRVRWKAHPHTAYITSGEVGGHAEDGARTREGRGAQRPRRGGCRMGAGGERGASDRGERVALDDRRRRQRRKECDRAPHTGSGRLKSFAYKS